MGDIVRRKHKQMSWLFENRPDCTWSLMGTDDGCPEDPDSSSLMESIVASEGYTNCTNVRLKEAVKAGTCDVLDNEKLKSEAWNLEDKLVKASQKGGAIIYGLWEANRQYKGDLKHIIVYTDSDLSTDLSLCGLNFKTIFDGADCSVSQRFGQPFAVNCGKLVQAGGVAPGMPRESLVHLSLRKKLRDNLLPPLEPITDTNCGHKAITAEASNAILKQVRDYKGSFDMDWLMCVGMAGKARGNAKPIGVTAIPWVNSVAESAFWGGGAGGEETEEEKKLKSATSWFKIFGTMCEMHGWHKDQLQKTGLLTADSAKYVEWVSGMTVQDYMKLSDAILANLEGKEVTMPEPYIMGLDLDSLKKLAS